MEPLKDPKNDRQIKTVIPPPQSKITLDKLKKGNKYDWELLESNFFNEGLITKEAALDIIKNAAKIIRNEPNMLEIKEPVNVVGDIHGQFHDLKKILGVGGNPENNQYLFLGDYVDRGYYGLEVICFIYVLKINYPNNIFLLRGNHESKQMTEYFNFKNEVIKKLDLEVYDLIIDSFEYLPISCLINGKFLAIHGGLSPNLKEISDINKINRFQEPPKEGVMCDFLWGDPVDNENGYLPTTFEYNQTRGCSYVFGEKALTTFLKKNKLISVIRAHEAQIEGYKMFNWSNKNFPQVITIFSAPNYCDTYNNKGAIIKFHNNTLNIQQFNFTKHAYHLPNFMDIFTWSMPFVTEKITEILYEIMKIGIDNIDEKEDVNIKELTESKVDINVLKNKINFISKMSKMQRILRENSEKIVEIKKVNGNKLPYGLLLEGEDALNAYLNAKNEDKINEKIPDNYK